MTPLDTARYTRDMLECLRKMAASQGQGVLAHLLTLARYEARTVERSLTTMTQDSPDDGGSGQPVPTQAEP
jgi:hypothetical protein